MTRELKERFENMPISRVIENELPLEQFKKGNFSQAYKIIDVYQETITRLRNNFMRDNIWTNDINSYIDAEKKRIEQVFLDVQGKETEINTVIKDQRKILKSLDVKYSKMPYWKGLIKILRGKTKCNPKKFKWLIESDFDNYPKNRDNAWTMYYELIDDDLFRQLLALQDSIDEKKKEIKTMEKDDWYTNIDNYYNALERWFVKESKEASAKEKIEKIFWKKIWVSTFDERDLKTIFLEKIVDKLILSSNTDKKTRLNLIRSYENKLDLFFYIFNEIYQGRWIWSNYTYDAPTNINDIKAEWKDRTEELCNHVEELIDLVQKNEMKPIGLSDYYVTKEELTFLKNELQNPNKKYWLPNYTEGDKSIRDIWIKIWRILDDSNLESEYQSLRNFDFKNIAESKEDIKLLLWDIFNSMTVEEQSQFQNRYHDENSMQRFIENVKSKREKSDEQISIRTDEEMEELNPTPKVEVEVYQKKRKKKK